MRHPIAATKVANEVRKLAEEYPNAVYKGICSYVKGAVENGPTEEGCIVGHALRRVYPDIENVLTRACVTEASADELRLERIISDAKVVEWIHIVQWHQDHNKTWSESVRLADDEA